MIVAIDKKVNKRKKHKYKRLKNVLYVWDEKLFSSHQRNKHILRLRSA